VTVYFCWVCEQVADLRVLPAPHYEQPGRVVRFCSEEHREEYLWLRRL
jgi:hypothetical protein